MPSLPSRISSARIFAFSIAASLFLWASQATSVQAAQPDEEDEPTVEFDIDRPPPARTEVTPYLYVGLSTNIGLLARDNLDLDDTNSDQLWRAIGNGQFAVAFRPTDWFEFFVNTQISHRIVQNKQDTQVGIQQMYVTFHEMLGGFSARIGRQRVFDTREWFLDENLDSVGLYYRKGSFGVEALVGERRLVNLRFTNTERSDDVTNYVLQFHYLPNMKHVLSAYVLARNSESNGGDNVVFTGLRAIGRFGESFNYWIDAAGVFGKGEELPSGMRPTLGGFGFDVGTTYHINSPLNPTITLSYAFGAGDNDITDGKDSSFRQTGIQDNQWRFNGLAYFNYYGEVLDPELHNLKILTIGAGIRPFRRASVDIVFHNYQQQYSDSTLRNANVRIAPLGIDTDIGDEVDLILAHRSEIGIGVNFAGGYFIPGKAFDDADGAWLARALLWYNF